MIQNQSKIPSSFNLGNWKRQRTRYYFNGQPNTRRLAYVRSFQEERRHYSPNRIRKIEKLERGPKRFLDLSQRIGGPYEPGWRDAKEEIECSECSRIRYWTRKNFRFALNVWRREAKLEIRGGRAWQINDVRSEAIMQTDKKLNPIAMDLFHCLHKSLLKYLDLLVLSSYLNYICSHSSWYIQSSYTLVVPRWEISCF